MIYVNMEEVLILNVIQREGMTRYFLSLMVVDLYGGVH